MCLCLCACVWRQTIGHVWGEVAADWLEVFHLLLFFLCSYVDGLKVHQFDQGTTNVHSEPGEGWREKRALWINSPYLKTKRLKSQKKQDLTDDKEFFKDEFWIKKEACFQVYFSQTSTKSFTSYVSMNVFDVHSQTTKLKEKKVNRSLEVAFAFVEKKLTRKMEEGNSCVKLIVT